MRMRKEIKKKFRKKCYNKNMLIIQNKKLIKILVISFFMSAEFFVFSSFAQASCDLNINSYDTFPYKLDQANKTYCLTSDIIAPTTAFVAKANDVTLDLQGHIVTYGNANFSEALNRDFENWSGILCYCSCRL